MTSAMTDVEFSTPDLPHDRATPQRVGADAGLDTREIPSRGRIGNVHGD